MKGTKERVVVFGGSGFLGSHTADALSDCGYDVVIFDNVESPWLGENQRMFVGDILDRRQVREAVTGAAYVYHFAGIAGIADAKDRPLDAVQLNVLGTANALQASVDAGIRRFVYASTMYVYSTFGSFYRATKQAAENIVEAYHECHGLQYSMLRYGSLYGPRAQGWNGLKDYVTQVVRDGKLRIVGDDQRVREYIHVKDAARLSVDVLDEKHANQAITVTGTQILKTSELSEMIFEIAGVKINVEPGPPEDLPTHYKITPYRYTPKPAKKLVPAEFVDIGQGILDLVEEVHAELGHQPRERQHM